LSTEYLDRLYTVCCLDDTSVEASLTIHSCKAHLVSTLTLSTTCLADAIIQLAIVEGQRHEVRLNGVILMLLRCVVTHRFSGHFTGQPG